MQNTRLNNLIGAVLTQLAIWASNPWRKISLSIISLLLGFFMATAISTVAGQKAEIDLSVAALLVLFTELVSRFVYSQRLKGISSQLLPRLVNFLKMGLTYGLFVEAFKLGS